MHPTPPDYATKADLHLGVAGKITQWHDEQGYGFIQTDRLPEVPIFFHISTVSWHKHRPTIGEHVIIKARYDAEQHRWTATQVSSPVRQQAVAEQEKRNHTLLRPMRDKLKIATPVSLLWLILIACFSPKLAAGYTIISLITLALYASDKRRAINQTSRIPERNLHTIALFGGWSGALIARYLFRHKTQKQPFISIFWLTVLCNIAFTAYLLHSGYLKTLFAMLFR